MTIPRVKTAIGASDTAMPAMPAPQAAFWGEGTRNFDFFLIPSFGEDVLTYEIKPDVTLLQIAVEADAVMLFDSPELISQLIGYPLKKGGYYTFSVTPGSTMYLQGTSDDFGTLFILEG